MPSFASPDRLLLLAAVLALAVGFAARAAARRRLVHRWAQAPLLASSAPRRPARLRSLTTALLLTSLALMTAAYAGPTVEREVQRERARVVLAVDTSASMLADDVEPDRFTAAKRAATAFVAGLPEGFEVALVGFAGTATVVVPATRDSDVVTRALDGLAVSGGTSLGDAVLTSITAAATRPEGVPATIVLLADGGSTVGTPVQQAIEAAVEADIPVTTIAYGTPGGVVVSDGRRFEVPVDQPALAAVAEGTGGQAYTAATGEQLLEVYDSIRARLSTAVEEQDVSAHVAGAALLLLAGACACWGLARGGV